MPPKTLISLTNIPTPYRVHFYNLLSSALRTRDIGLEVLFMARSEAGRNWQLADENWEFVHVLGGGIHPMIGNRQFHFNPDLLARLHRRPPDWLMVSGSWYFPTAFLGNWIARRQGSKTLFWSESNLEYIEHASKLARRARGAIMDSFDAYVVPGAWAREYVLAQAASASQKPVLRLPNVVDERAFCHGVTERRQRADELKQKWSVQDEPSPILLAVLRLEPIKGIAELVSAWLEMDFQSEATLLVAGEGSLRGRLESLIAAKQAQGRIRLLGYVEEAGILELLAIADGFILPSLGDPYPLAAIEAAFASLPLLLSTKVGCHPELLEQGANGFLFDPQDRTSVGGALEAFRDLGPSGWRRQGNRSLEIAERDFKSQPIVERFVEELLQV